MWPADKMASSCLSMSLVDPLSVPINSATSVSYEPSNAAIAPAARVSASHWAVELSTMLSQSLSFDFFLVALSSTTVLAADALALLSP